MLQRRRRVGEEAVTADRARSSGGPLSTQYPCLVEFLLLTEWEDEGGQREPGSVLLFVQDDLVKVRLVDNDADEVCFIAGNTLYEALENAERSLREGGGDWRPQRAEFSRKKPRK